MKNGLVESIARGYLKAIVESTVGEMDAQVGVEDDQGIAHGVQDALGQALWLAVYNVWLIVCNEGGGEC